MLSRRQLLGGALAVAGCARSALEGDVPANAQVIPVKFGGLDTASDPKSAPFGRCDVLENTQTQRLTEGGIEIEKRPGTPSLSLAIQGGGSVAAGKKVAAFDNRLVMTDGHKLYSRASAEEEWVPRGKVCDMSAQLKHIVSAGINRIETDVAYADGYACWVISRYTGGTETAVEWYVEELATGDVVGSGSIASSYMARVQAISSAFFLFAWNGFNGAGVLTCYKIATATPSTISAGATVASNLGSNIYDVIADVTNTKLWVVYEHDSTGTGVGVAIKPWTTANASGGTATNYTTRDPDVGIGFLDHTFANGFGYVAIGCTAAGDNARLLRFDTATWTVGTDTQISATNYAQVCTGYFSTVPNVYYTDRTAGPHTSNVTLGWSNGTGFTAMRSVGIAGRVFSMDGKRYLPVIFDEVNPALTSEALVAHQRSRFLLEMETDATSASQVSVAAYLLGGNAGSDTRPTRGTPGGVAVVSATRALMAMSVLSQPAPVGGSGAGQYRFGLVSADLDWTGTLTGAPVAFNGSLYLPGAAPKIFDGTSVIEHGFLCWPPPPTVTEAAGGSLDVTATYQYALTYARVHPSGRLERSGVSLVASVTLTGANRTASVVCPHLCVTESDPSKNANPLVAKVRVEVWRTQGDGSLFTLRHVAINDPTTASFTLSDGIADTTILPDEGLYTDRGEVDHVAPPAVLSFCAHRDRMFALCGDDTVWLSKDAAEGDVAGFSDADSFRIPFDTTEGRLVSMASDGTTLFVAKRNRVHLVQGDGPDFAGGGAYAYPQPLPSEAGFRVARGFVATPDGMIVDTAKGKHLLDRAGGMQPVPGVDTYDSLAVTGGVTLDDRPMALLTTSDGRTLCWDWQNKVWHTWTGQAAVACCRWRNLFVWLESNGKVHVETPGAYSDDAGAYVWAVEPTWFNIRHSRIRKGLLYADVRADLTVSYVVSYDLLASTAETARTLAVTATSPIPLVLIASKGRANALKYRITETSTTAGLRLSSLELEVVPKPGAAKFPAGSYLR